MVNKKTPVTRDELEEAFKTHDNDFKNELMKIKDEIIGELRNVREEMEILSSQHGRILDLEENVEQLQKIHPRNQHASL